MNRYARKMFFIGFVLFQIISVTAIGNQAFASEGSGDWRPIYDKAMILVNFSILVFLFIKFAKNPLKDFLANRKLEMAREIKRVEDEKKKWIEKIKSARKNLDESEERLQKIKERIIEQGEKKKQDIIDEGKKQGEILIDNAKRKINNDIVQAKKMLRSELVDGAMELAKKNLPNEINEKDKEKFIDQYLTNISKE